MDRNPNPNPHDRLRQNAVSSWSELPTDLSKSVFERLSFADFERAKTVCSSWYSASRQSVPKNQIPWLILFPEDKEKTCTLFNPEVKDKLYKTRDLGSEFAKSFCLATYGNWFLMRDPLYDLYILNLFTNERINLPHALSQLGEVKIERTLHDDWFLISYGRQRECEALEIRSPLFWIDEKTKEYFVVWGVGKWCVVYAKNGDDIWKQIPKTSSCFSMAYKDHKLYFSGCRNSFRIFDFSGEIPVQCGMYRFCLDPLDYDVSDFSRAVDWKLVVTVNGDVLEVFRLLLDSGVWSFRVYKVYLSGSFKKYKRVDSLGDEAMLLDLGITVLANGIEGLKKNCIYFNASHEKKPTEICFFSGYREKNPTEICVFDLETQKMEALHKIDCSSVQLFKARWFLPSFMQT